MTETWKSPLGKRPRTYSPEFEQTVLQAFREGKSASDIGRETNKPAYLIRLILQRFGLKASVNQRRGPQGKPPETQQAIVVFYQEPHTIHATMERFGMSYGGIRKILSKNNALRGDEGRRAFSPDEVAEMKRLFLAGTSLCEIAEQFHTCARTTERWLHENGVELPVKKDQRRTELAEGVAEAIKALWADGNNTGTIAEACGLKRGAVIWFIRREGLSRPRKDGRIFHRRDGYWYILVRADDPMHAMANTNSYVLEHRLVVARHLGRPLTRHETVHHINGDKNDNRLDNLQLRHGNHGTGIVLQCRCCGSTDITERPLAVSELKPGD
jgi:transposase-like protein